MPRIGRVVAPNMPHHIVQRGHNKNIVFVQDADYEYYLTTLVEWKKHLGVKVYAWCLMTNHVHLILDPGNNIKSIGLLVKRLAGRQTRFVNKTEGRTGSLWDGRYKSSIIDKDAYFLQCCRYVELNPVKARMVKKAEDYRWSSYREKMGVDEARTVDLGAFGRLAQLSRSGYRRFINQHVSPAEQSFIRERVESNQLTGSTRFVEEIEQRTGVRLEPNRPGRPKNPKSRVR